MLAVAAPFVSMAISGKPGLEVDELPGGGEEEVDVASIATSGDPGLEVGEPPGGGEEVDVAYMAISGEPGPEAHGERIQGQWWVGHELATMSPDNRRWPPRRTKFTAVLTKLLNGLFLVRLKLHPR